MPMAIPSAVSIVRVRRARSPMVPTRERSAARSRLRDDVAAPAHTATAVSSSTTRPSRIVDPPGGAGGDLSFMGDQHDRAAAVVQLGQQLDDGAAGAAVEVPRRLIGEDDRGVTDESAGDGDPLALAARQFARNGGRLGRRARQLQRLGGRLQPVPSSDPGVQQAVGHVLEGRQALDEVELLEHEPDAAPAHGGQPGVAQRAHIDAIDAHRSRRRSLQCADDVEQRRLAGARRTDDDRELAGDAR